MGVVGGYDLHCYCDNKDCKAPYHDPEMVNQFCEPTKQMAYLAARSNGWQFKRGTEMKCYCPNCSPPRPDR